MASNYYIGKLEKTNNGYLIHKPYDLTGSNYGFIYDWLRELGIVIEYDLCYGETDDWFSPIVYKQEEWFYKLADVSDTIEDFSRCENIYVVKDNDYISEEDTIKLDNMGNIDFQKQYPLLCDGLYHNGIRYCVNTQKINRTNYCNINNIINIDEFIKEKLFNIEGRQIVTSAFKDIYKWLKNNDYIYVYKYY